MASAIYIVDTKGNPLIYRSYRGDLTEDVPFVFQRRVIDEEEFRITPVFEERGHLYVFIRENDVYLLMVSRINISPLLQIAFLRSCVQVFDSYFKKVTEETVRDNFVIIYELLDEMCDFGFPQFSEEKVLKEYITQEGLISLFVQDDRLHAKTLPSAVTGTGGATPWRAPGQYKYRKNEVFVDVVESINLLVGQDGETLSSEVVGAVKMKVHLSGMPTVHIGLNDKMLLTNLGRTGRSVEMDDVKFHQCVKLNQFEKDRIISCTPPDGEFQLFTYRLSKRIAPLVAVRCNVVRHGTSRVEMYCIARTNFRRNSNADFVEIAIPIPSDADKPEARCSLGSIKYAPESNKLIWSIYRVGSSRNFNCRCQFHLPSVRSTDANALSKAPIQVRFRIPYFAASGIQVRYVKVMEKTKYTATPWVRYLTRSGDYQIRTN